MANVDPIDLQGLKTYSIAKRRNLVKVRDFGTLADGRKAADFINSLPSIYAGRDLRALINDIVRAARKKKTVACAMGGHVIKVGCGPVLADLVERGVITAIAMNGAAAIHDYELSRIGETSEDVAETLQNGSFGMARETAEAFAEAALVGSSGSGLGRAIAEKALKNKHRKISLLAACAKRRVPVTVHLSVGADITHMHPQVSGRDLGESTLIDFRILSSVVAGLDGGVWMNVGSAVMMPEVFLKAVSVARNLGHKLSDFTTVNLDMIQHYRPRANVLARPRGKAIAITGHHEILLPLVRAGVVAALGGRAIRP
jgi:deoxyhypusine synthase